MINEEALAEETSMSLEAMNESADSIDSEDVSEHDEDVDASHTKSDNESPSDEDADADAALTQAKLLTFSDMGDPWMSIGDGVVSVEISIESTSGAVPVPPHPCMNGGQGKMGKAEAPNEVASGLVCQRVARLRVAEPEDPDDVLLSTPIDVDGVYQNRDGDIIVWDDAQLGRSIALKFVHSDGCTKILSEITEFQRSEIAKRHSVATETPLKEGSGMTGSGTIDLGASPVKDRFAVSVANLPNILGAVHTNPLIFGAHVREDVSYFRQLANLFDDCREEGDTASMESIAQITLSLLGPPYNSEGRILSQFMESTYVDKCVDIVQYALGRKNKDNGFVSFEERRATFKNPLHLPESVLHRIHLLHSALYLRDLLPLNLDEGDGGSPCILNLLLVRFKFTLINEICTKPEFLQHAFELSQDAEPDREAMYSLAAFVQDMSKSIRNSPVAFDMKEEMYNTMIQSGLFAFCQRVLYWGLQDIQADRQAAGGLTRTATEPAARQRSSAEKAVEASCDVLSHCLFVVTSARDNLTRESKERPTQCSLALVMKSLSLLHHSSALQAAYDVVVGAATGAQSLQAFPGFMDLGAERAVIRFWVEGSDGHVPPLFIIASHLAGLLRKAESAPVNGKLTAGWTHGEELQLVYGFRVLIVVSDKVKEGFRSSFADVLVESGVLPAARGLMMQVRTRSLVNIQSSVVSFLAKLVNMGDGNIMRLFEAGDADRAEKCDEAAGASEALGDGDPARPPGDKNLLSACMSLFLACSRRDSILSAALGSLFVNLCAEVHQETIQLAEASTPSPTAQQPSFVTPMDGSNASRPDLTGPDRAVVAQRHYQKAAAALMSAYGDELAQHAPVVAERLRISLNETPEEAKLADAETSSLPSTIGRPGENLADFDMMAMEFGVDMTLPASVSHSLTSSPLSDAAIGASEDSLLSELADLDSDAKSSASVTEEGETSSENEDSDAERETTGADDKPAPPSERDDAGSMGSGNNERAKSPTQNEEEGAAFQPIPEKERGPPTPPSIDKMHAAQIEEDGREEEASPVRASGVKRDRSETDNHSSETTMEDTDPSATATSEDRDKADTPEKAEQPVAKVPKTHGRRR